MRELLLVEDETDIRTILRGFLETMEARVTDCGTVSEAVSALEKRHFDMVITDFHLPDGTGGDVLAAVQEHGGADTTVLITGNISGVPSHILKTASHVIEKPTVYGPLVKLLNSAEEVPPSAASPAA